MNAPLLKSLKKKRVMRVEVMKGFIVPVEEVLSIILWAEGIHHSMPLLSKKLLADKTKKTMYDEASDM